MEQLSTLPALQGKAGDPCFTSSTAADGPEWGPCREQPVLGRGGVSVLLSANHLCHLFILRGSAVLGLLPSCCRGSLGSSGDSGEGRRTWKLKQGCCGLASRGVPGIASLALKGSLPQLAAAAIAEEKLHLLAMLSDLERVFPQLLLCLRVVVVPRLNLNRKHKAAASFLSQTPFILNSSLPSRCCFHFFYIFFSKGLKLTTL